MKIALLVIDMQKIFLNDYTEKSQIHKACEHINYVANLLRSNDHLVVHVKDVEAETEDNFDKIDFIDDIQLESKDKVMKKLHSNSFWETELEQLLNEENVGLVIISGFAAEHCVLFTYNGARERGFRTVILQNGIIGERQLSVEQMYLDRNVISHPVVSFMVSQT